LLVVTRSGGHDVLAYDWDQYLRFATQHLTEEVAAEADSGTSKL
jgi:hypothetical protein